MTEPHPRRWFILAILTLSLVLIVASVSSLNLAIPSIQRALNASAAELVWINAAYALVFAGLLLPAGAVGDRFGRRGSLQAGLGTFIVAASLATFSESTTQLIVLRAIMGIGAALTMPATLSIITVPPPTSAPRPSPSGPASPAPAAPSASLPAGFSLITSSGALSSW